MEEQSRFLLELRKHLIDHWNKFELPGSPSGLAYRIRQTHRGRSIDKNQLVALWFTDNPEEPQVVTKWVLSKNFSKFIEIEHKSNCTLYQAHKKHFVPRPLDYTEILGSPVLIEEAVLGRSLAHQIISLPFGKEKDESKIHAITSSIFQKVENVLNMIKQPLPPVPKNKLLEEIDSIFNQACTYLNWPIKKREEVSKILSTQISDPVPGSGSTLLIGDFAPHNILDGRNGLFLIDLEFSRESIAAFLDPLSFVYNAFRLATPAYLRKDPKEASEIFLGQILDKKSLLGKLGEQFLENRGIPKEHLLWYWLIFFIYETNFLFPLEEGAERFSKLMETHISTLLEAVAQKR